MQRLERSSADTGSLTAARALLAGGSDPEAVTAAVRRLRADVVHAHNLHPLFGWRALAAARAAGARTVLHLHNYRLFCAIGVAYRDGAPCFRCRQGDTWPGLRLRCRGSLGEAAVYAAGLRRQQPGLFEHAGRFVAVSEAAAARLIELGLPAAKTTALLNFIPTDAFVAASRAEHGEYALVSGRLVEEKGYDTAIAAARAAGVAARGRRLGTRRGASAAPGRRRRGPVHRSSDARRAGRAARRRGGGAGPVALGRAVPVLGGARRWPTAYRFWSQTVGACPSWPARDASLPAEDVSAWTEALSALWRDRDARARAGAAALQRARETFSEDAYYERLMADLPVTMLAPR